MQTRRGRRAKRQATRTPSTEAIGVGTPRTQLPTVGGRVGGSVGPVTGLVRRKDGPRNGTTLRVGAEVFSTIETKDVNVNVFTKGL